MARNEKTFAAGNFANDGEVCKRDQEKELGLNWKHAPAQEDSEEEEYIQFSEQDGGDTYVASEFLDVWVRDSETGEAVTKGEQSKDQSNCGRPQRRSQSAEN